MALLYFVQISRSRSPQLSPCHNRTQITLKSKQEFPGFVNFTFSVYFPILSSKDDISFRHELLRFGTCKVQPSELTVQLDSLGQRPK